MSVVADPEAEQIGRTPDSPTADPLSRPARQFLRDSSIEITSRDVGDLGRTATLLPPGTRTAVTALPSESASQIVGAVKAVLGHGLLPVTHISARRLASRCELESLLEELAAMAATTELFVIGGDLDVPIGPYPDALAVIASGLLRRFGVQRVGIGGYPEGHPKIDERSLWQAMQDKLASLREQDIAASIVTQFGFDADAAVAWTRRVRDKGIEVPIRIGVPGPANASTLIRFAARCGVGASRSVLRKYGLSLTQLLRPAGPDAYVHRVAEGLSQREAGDVTFHFYPFGGLERTARWIAETRASNGAPPKA